MLLYVQGELPGLHSYASDSDDGASWRFAKRASKPNRGAHVDMLSGSGCWAAAAKAPGVALAVATVTAIVTVVAIAVPFPNADDARSNHGNTYVSRA